jgi:hypothetical protein
MKKKKDVLKLSGRRTSTNGALNHRQQSEHRNAVGVNTPQKQGTGKTQEKQATRKGLLPEP